MTDKKSLSNQLGYYVGEYIVNRYLPSLSCDASHTRTVIDVNEDDARECDILDKAWFKTAMKNRGNGKPAGGDTEEWKSLQECRQRLKVKYLPEKLECPLPILVLDDMDITLFKEGLGVSLWDCDMSYYSCDPKDIEIVLPKEEYDRTTIFLKRD